jgi:hypothetical protein
MVAHENAAAPSGNVFKSADLDLDAGSPHSRIRDPHRHTVKKTDISNQQRVGNTDNSGNWTEREIDKNQLERCKHTTLKLTGVEER